MRIGLVQINNSFSRQHYLPYSIGLLQAYAQRHAPQPDAYEFLPPIYSRVRVTDALAGLRGADVVGFSAYVWNVRLSLEIARRLKAERPEVRIVFGGPQVPDDSEAFLRANRFVDFACHGEGEAAFLALLEGLRRGDVGDVPSISYLEGEHHRVHPRAPRIHDLAEIPSPYLAGVFDPLMRRHPEHEWLALWETNRGCPFACTFCDWGSATASRVFRFEMDRIYAEIDWFADRRIEFVFCCDANFGILPRDVDIARRAAETRARRGYPQALSVQNTKNATERAYLVQKLLAESGLNKGVTISFQSLDDQTLSMIKRENISSDSFRELQRRFTRDRIETYTDLILGLPGETYGSFADGVARCIDDGQHNRIQFNNLSILPNAEMADPEYRRKYGLVTVESAIINIHGAVDDAEEIRETQELVIATDAMPAPDWVRTRAFCWTAALLHFDKVLQIPLVLARDVGGVGYRELFEVFQAPDPARDPVLAGVAGFFREKARDIQAGGPEYCAAERWLRIWWPADEYVLIDLCLSGRLPEFYAEAERALADALEARGARLPEGALHDAIVLNRSLLKVPFEREPLEVALGYDLWSFHRARLLGDEATLEARPSVRKIDRSPATWPSADDWCREVVWYGNKKGAYLYGSEPVEPQLEGHY
jgi:radical SAM superfamily enzyme YgiQ (UPF0313 family)